jgi:hypothetical protein
LFTYHGCEGAGAKDYASLGKVGPEATPRAPQPPGTWGTECIVVDNIGTITLFVPSRQSLASAAYHVPNCVVSRGGAHYRRRPVFVIAHLSPSHRYQPIDVGNRMLHTCPYPRYNAGPLSCAALCKIKRVQLQLGIYLYYLRLAAYKVPGDCRRTDSAPSIHFRMALRVLVVCEYAVLILQKRHALRETYRFVRRNTSGWL